jgi:2-oxoglutarate dehydrogenase complex dehydrogenase (E1) component-like enzyme
MRRNYFAPMVIFTPKSLLRLPAATSLVEEFTTGRFQPVIDDAVTLAAPERVERVLFSFGKVYYDIVSARERFLGDAAGKVAVVRIEELYPWPEAELQEVLSRYASAASVCWVQEEPANMGAWTFTRDRLESLLQPGSKLGYAGRAPSASPATGSMRIHKQEQKGLLQDAFEGL